MKRWPWAVTVVVLALMVAPTARRWWRRWTYDGRGGLPEMRVDMAEAEGVCIICGLPVVEGANLVNTVRGPVHVNGWCEHQSPVIDGDGDAIVGVAGERLRLQELLAAGTILTSEEEEFLRA